MFTVIKANGEQEAFSDEKVLNSIRRARIPQEIQYEALAHVKEKLYEGISTEEIYQHILEFLDRSARPYTKARYSLKEAIMQLGPTGYPFEDFVARLLESFGYQTKVRQILRGKCVTHEIDIIAEKDGKTAAIEAKFHNSPGTRSEIHVALYTQARFQDIQFKNKIDEIWLVTNTKTTIDANTYAHCSGMKVVSWSYPEGGSLRDMVEQSRLHPVTVLNSLSPAHKKSLLENHIVLCKDIYTDKNILDILPLSHAEKEKIFTEVTAICAEEKIS